MPEYDFVDVEEPQYQFEDVETDLDFSRAASVLGEGFKDVVRNSLTALEGFAAAEGVRRKDLPETYPSKLPVDIRPPQLALGPAPMMPPATELFPPGSEEIIKKLSKSKWIQETWGRP